MCQWRTRCGQSLWFVVAVARYVSSAGSHSLLASAARILFPAGGKMERPQPLDWFPRKVALVLGMFWQQNYSLRSRLRVRGLAARPGTYLDGTPSFGAPRRRAAIPGRLPNPDLDGIFKFAEYVLGTDPLCEADGARPVWQFDGPTRPQLSYSARNGRALKGISPPEMGLPLLGYHALGRCGMA